MYVLFRKINCTCLKELDLSYIIVLTDIGNIDSVKEQKFWWRKHLVQLLE